MDASSDCSAWAGRHADPHAYDAARIGRDFVATPRAHHRSRTSDGPCRDAAGTGRRSENVDHVDTCKITAESRGGCRRHAEALRPIDAPWGASSQQSQLRWRAGRTVAGSAVCALLTILSLLGHASALGLAGVFNTALPAPAGTHRLQAFVAPNVGLGRLGLGAKLSANLCALGAARQLCAPRIQRSRPAVVGLSAVWISDQRFVAGSSDDDDRPDSADGAGMSAQERGLLRILHNRMHRRETAAGAAPAAATSEDMAKVRRKEKLALRGAQPHPLSRKAEAGPIHVRRPSVAADRTRSDAGSGGAVGFAKGRAAGSSPRGELAGRPASPRLRSRVAVRKQTRSDAAQGMGARAPEGKVGTLPRKAPAGRKPAAAPSSQKTPAAPWLPRKLAAYCKLSELVDALEPVAEHGGNVGAFNAVGAMNRMRRLQRQAAGNRALDARAAALQLHFGALVLEQMDSLGGKLLSLTVNAVAESPQHRPLMRAAAARAAELARESGPASGFDAQALSVTANAFARARMRDERLFAALSEMVCSLAERDPGQLNAQAVSVLLNAYAKLQIRDARLFRVLADVTRAIPRADFCPQAIVNILNALARHGEHNSETVAFLSDVARGIAPEEFLSRHLAIAANAIAKMDMCDRPLLAFIARAALARPVKSFDVQAVANLLNAFGKLRGRDMDQKLLAHMTHALRQTPPSAFDPTSLASSVGALVKVGHVDRGLFKHLSGVAISLDPLLFDAQSVSTVMQSWAKAEIRDVKLFKRMSLAVKQMAFMLEPQSIALVVNACAKAEHRDEALLAHLSRVAQRQPPDAFTAQHVDTIVNGYARLQYRDKALFRCMSRVTLATPPAAFDWQAVAITMNAFAKALTHDRATRDVFRYFTDEVVPELDGASMTQPVVSIMLNGYAKTEMREEEPIAALCAGIRRLAEAEGAFDVRNVASVMHALATLDLSDPRVVELMVGELLRHEGGALHAEEVAIIAWSSAVMGLRDQRLIDWLLGGLRHHLPEMDHNFRRQAQQFVLSCELDGLLALSTLGVSPRRADDAPGEWARRVFLELGGARSKLEAPRRSRLQQDVAETIRGMQLQFEEEYVHEASGYSLDIFLSDGRTSIEVDGPSHFAAGSHVPLGGTLMKRRHLQQLGFDLRVLPYWEWDELDTLEQKRDYIRHLLTSTPSLSF